MVFIVLIFYIERSGYYIRHKKTHIKVAIV